MFNDPLTFLWSPRSNLPGPSWLSQTIWWSNDDFWWRLSTDTACGAYGSHADVVNTCLWKLSLWNKMHILKLHTNMWLQHSPEDASFSQWLLDVGHGWNVDKNGKIDIPPSMVTFSKDELISEIYGDISEIPLTPPPIDYFLDHAILVPWNVNVQQVNKKILNNMQGSEIISYSANSLEDKGKGICDDVPKDFFHTLDTSLLLLSELKMKVGCPLMLLQNLDPGRGLCNSMRMILLQMYPCILEVIIIGGDHHRQKAFIPRITLKPSSHRYPFTIRQHQFPIHLSFAMTINKSQGQSLKYIGIHLISPVFCHGQLYVTLSWATSSQNIHILLPKATDTKITNVIHIPWNSCRLAVPSVVKKLYFLQDDHHSYCRELHGWDRR